MTTDDTDALTEKIEEALWGLWKVYDAPDGGTETFVHAPVHEVVAAVLSGVTEEVRKAKAEALREAAERAQHELGWENGGHTSAYSVRHWLDRRAAEHETGDTDGHR